MKKLILSLCAGIMIAAVSCKSGPSSSDPKATLKSFFKALAAKDIDAAKKLATKESESMLAMMEMGMKMAENKKEEEDEFKKFNPDDMVMGDPVINGDKATVAVTNKKENETSNFILRKQDGAWKVAFDKASMAEMGEGKMKDEGVDTEEFNEALKNLNADSLKEAMKALEDAGKSLDSVMKQN